MADFSTLEKVEIVTLGTPEWNDFTPKARILYDGISSIKLASALLDGKSPVTLRKTSDISQRAQNRVLELNVETHGRLDNVISQTIALAQLFGAPVNFVFNQVENTILPSDTPMSALERHRVADNNRINALFESPAGQAQLAAAALRNKQTQENLDRGWTLLNSLQKRDDDKVMEAIGLMADGYEDTKSTKPAPFPAVGEKLRALGYLSFEQLSENVLKLAEESGITEAHKAAVAATIAGSYMKFNWAKAANFTERYFKRFGPGSSEIGGRSGDPSAQTPVDAASIGPRGNPTVSGASAAPA